MRRSRRAGRHFSRKSPNSVRYVADNSSSIAGGLLWRGHTQGDTHPSFDLPSGQMEVGGGAFTGSEVPIDDRGHRRMRRGQPPAASFDDLGLQSGERVFRIDETVLAEPIN